MGTSVLIVEDDSSLQQMLTWELEELGYSVTAVGSCRGTRTLAGERRFDLALLDYQLPDGNGIELMEELRMSQPGLPVIMSSGICCTDTAARALRSGAWRFVPKPASIALLHRLFQSALSRIAGGSNA
jgi:DNA-binding response OmpR family regulator